jgi:hypothetical protein
MVMAVWPTRSRHWSEKPAIGVQLPEQPPDYYAVVVELVYTLDSESNPDSRVGVQVAPTALKDYGSIAKVVKAPL